MNFLDITEQKDESPNDVLWFNILANKIHINDCFVDGKIVNTGYTILQNDVLLLQQQNTTLQNTITNLQIQITTLQNEIILFTQSYILLTSND